jgi:hypothetical protein
VVLGWAPEFEEAGDGFFRGITASLRGGSVLRPYEALAWDNRDGGGVLLMVDQQL